VNKRLLAGDIAVPGFADYSHIEEDFSVAFDLRLNEEEQSFLENQQVRAAAGYCRQCAQCVAGCPGIAGALSNGELLSADVDFLKWRHILNENPDVLAACQAA
jgi:ferredoxin